MTKEKQHNNTEKKQLTKNSVLKKTGISVGILCLFLILAAGAFYLADYFRIKEQFSHSITINGQSYYGMTAGEVAQKLDSEFQNCRLSIIENGSSVYELSMGEAGYSLDTSVLSASLEELIQNQKPGLHFFQKPKDQSVEYPYQRADDIFSNIITADHLSGERTDPVNAYLTYDDAQGKFIIVSEAEGNKIADDSLKNLVSESVSSQLNPFAIPETLEVNLDDSVYIKPEITSSNEDLINQVNALNDEITRYRNTTITYQLGDTKEVIDGSLISSWLMVDKETNSVQLSEELIRDYISQLAGTYNTIYRDRNFTTSTGETVKLEHNEYGYRIDQEAEYQQLCQDLASGEAIEREPVYSKSGYKRNGKDDLVGCYVEVSIDKQHLWLYKDGALITETDIVSGKPGDKTSTYKGAWSIAYKASPYTLSSDIYGYEVPVTYWMPFVYGQGLHDINRSAFGGEIYKTNGSHGCVNLPIDQAKIIYETVDKGYAVIIY